MQTFLPYADFARSAACLDRQRLGKQRVEVLQLLRALNGRTKGWVQHPAARMWSGHEVILAHYGLVICDEWIRRGYRDTCRKKILNEVVSLMLFGTNPTVPSWLGNDALHRSHRSNLVRKNATHYRPIFPDVPDFLPYVWPVPKTRQ